MTLSAFRRALRRALEALALAAGLACLWPGGARAQLPAPPASARAPLRLGAYGSLVLGLDEVNAGAPAGTPVPSGVTGSAVGLLVSGTLAARFGYFGEVDGAGRSWENWPGREDKRGWDVARLYGELTVGDALRLRAGRFLTPVGQWNEIHADPLTWTSLRPLTTYRAFAKSVTGFMAAGSLPLAGHDAGYALFLAPFPSPGSAGEETAFVSAGGGRVAIELLPNLYLGTSAAVFRASRPRAADEEGSDTPGATPGSGGEPGDALARASVLRDGGEAEAGGDREEDGVARRLLGADVSWTHGRLELLAEATLLSAQPGRPAEQGAFAQAALPLAGPLFLVARSEIYTPVLNAPLRIQTLGLTARPTRNLTLKLERQLPSRATSRAVDGWFASASAIF